MQRWVPNGSAHISMPTLGNLLGRKIRIVIERFSYDNVGATNCYLFSQMGSTAGTREFGLFFNNADNDVELFYGGRNNIMLTDSRQIFFNNASGSVENVLFDFEVNTATGAWRQLIDGVQASSGTVSLTGTGRIDGMVARIDVSIYIDDVLVRHLVMPGGIGTVIPDVVAANDGALINGSLNGVDWNTFLESDAVSVSVEADNLTLQAASIFTLVVDEVALASLLDGVDLHQGYIIAVADLGLAVAAEGVALSQANILAVNEMAAAVTMDSVALSTAGLLLVDGVAIASALDSVQVAQTHVLEAADLLVVVGTDSVALALNVVLEPGGLALDVLVDALVLDQSSLLVLDGIGISTVADSPILVQQGSLSVNGARVSILMDSLAMGGGVFVADSAIGMLVSDFEYVLLEGG